MDALVDSRFERPVFARLRRMCLALPDTTEAVAWGHPNFRVAKKTFCALEILKGRPSVALGATSAEVKRLMKKKDFFGTPYGRLVYVSRWLDGDINWRELETLVKKSYRLAISKASPKSRRRKA